MLWAWTDVPERKLPADDWEHRELYSRVREAVASLPVCFRTETRISGIMATDLHTLNTVLGAAIEEQVVRTLNLTRSTWDPDGRYALYSFVRQAQTFPTSCCDGLPAKRSCWESISRVGTCWRRKPNPGLRFQVTENACAEQDLIVVVPWVLGRRRVSIGTGTAAS